MQPFQYPACRGVREIKIPDGLAALMLYGGCVSSVETVPCPNLARRRSLALRLRRISQLETAQPVEAPPVVRPSLPYRCGWTFFRSHFLLLVRVLLAHGEANWRAFHTASWRPSAGPPAPAPAYEVAAGEAPEDILRHTMSRPSLSRRPRSRNRTWFSCLSLLLHRFRSERGPAADRVSRPAQQIEDGVL